jgi:hypothetical protein
VQLAGAYADAAAFGNELTAQDAFTAFGMGFGLHAISGMMHDPELGVSRGGRSESPYEGRRYGPNENTRAYDHCYSRVSEACFSGRMLIDMAGGKKLAAQVRRWDWVASRNEFDPDAPIEYKQVEEVFVDVAAIVNLHVSDQIIETTAKHPFYVPGEGWVEAGSLRIGDFVAGRDGKLLLVHGVAASGRLETVYNWRIGEHHTYFVSAEESGAAICAHNACSSTSGETAAAARGRAAHDAFTDTMEAKGKQGETRLTNGMKVDGLKFNKSGSGGIVYELKPRSNPRSLARGTAQLGRYLPQVARDFGGTWRGVVTFY